MRILLSLFVFIFASTAANADEPRPSLEAQLEAMSKLHPFAGTWLGEGWFTLNGERTELDRHRKRFGNQLINGDIAIAK